MTEEIPYSARHYAAKAKEYAEQAHADQIQSDWTQSDNTKVDFIKNKPTLATVATSGSYNDLANKLTAGNGISISNNEISLNVTYNSSTETLAFES